MKKYILLNVFFLTSVVHAKNDTNITNDLNLLLEEQDKKHPLLKWKYFPQNNEEIFLKEKPNESAASLDIRSLELMPMILPNSIHSSDSQAEKLDKNFSKPKTLEEVISEIDNRLFKFEDLSNQVSGNTGTINRPSHSETLNSNDSTTTKWELNPDIFNSKQPVFKQVEQWIKTSIYRRSENQLTNNPTPSDDFYYDNISYPRSTEYFAKETDDYSIQNHLLRYNFLLADSYFEKWQESYADYVEQYLPHKQGFLPTKELELTSKLSGFENKTADVLQLTSEMVANALPQNACLITYYVDFDSKEVKGVLFANILSWNGEIQSVKLSNITDLDLQLIRFKLYRGEMTENKILRNLGDIYDRVMLPIVKKLPSDTDTIIIAPIDNASIPFPVLFDQSPVGNPFLSETFSKVAGILILLIFIYLMLKEIKEKITHKKRISLSEMMVMRTRNRFIEKINFNELTPKELIWIIFGGIITCIFVATVFRPNEYDVYFIFFLAAWFIVSDIHWVHKNTLPKVRRIFLYIAHLLAPLAFVLLCLVVWVISLNASDPPMICTFVCFSITLWRIAIHHIHKKNHNRKFVFSLLALVCLPTLAWISSDPYFLKKGFQMLPFQHGEFLAEKFDILHVQTGRDLIENQNKWERPTKALTILSERNSKMEDSFFNSKKDSLSELNINHHSIKYNHGDERYKGALLAREVLPKPNKMENEVEPSSRNLNVSQIISLPQQDDLVKQMSLEIHRGNRQWWTDKTRHWLIFGGWKPVYDGEIKTPEWKFMKSARLISKKFENFAFSLWHPEDTKASNDFLCEFYKEAIDTKNAPRAFAHVQREKIVNAENKLSAILNYGGYRLIFRGACE